MVDVRGRTEAAELEDRKLILSAAGGDRAAFTELVRRRRPLVHRLASAARRRPRTSPRSSS